MVTTAIALERFRLDRGSYPEKLLELVPDYLINAPIDPWDGAELLHYTIRPAGRPAVWSIGEDRKDEC